MTLSCREVEGIADELRRQCVGAVVQKVVQTGPETVVLSLFGPAGQGATWLLLSASAQHGRLYLLSGKPPGSGDAAPAFCMQLRKELIGLRLAAVDSVHGERAVELRFVRRLGARPADAEAAAHAGAIQAAGEARRLRLFLYGRSAQLVLTDEEGAALGSVGPARRLHAALPGPRPEAIAAAADRFSMEPARSSAMEREYERRLDADRQARAQAEARARLSEESARLARLVRALEEDLARAQGTVDKKRWADLILSQLGSVPRGARSVRLADVFADGAPVDIPLDPALSPQLNAAKLYREHRRLVRSIPRIESRLGELRALLRDADAVRLGATLSSGALVRARGAEGPRGASRAGDSTGPLRDGRSARATPVGRKPPYREFRASTGAPVLVGRSAERNDELTFRVARGSDLWLHVRDRPGSHVIVPLDGGRVIDQDTLDQAALLAAWFSSARAELQVDVGYCFRKELRRAARGRPGAVFAPQQKTVRVRQDAERLAALLASEQD